MFLVIVNQFHKIFNYGQGFLRPSLGLLYFFIHFYELIPVSSEFGGKIREPLQGFQAGRDIHLITLVVANVFEEVLYN